jgi:signal transduction histidine kinase
VFKNLRTGTKLVILCGMFIVSIAATMCSLVAEKQIAIEFARKELVGSRYLAAVRSVYAAVLAEPPIGLAAALPGVKADDILRTLASAQVAARETLQTGELAQELTGSLRLLWAGHLEGAAANAFALDALASARQLVARIADDSNLALDPDLDTYHIQDLVTRKLPEFLSQLGEVQILSRNAAATGTPTSEQKVRYQVLEGLLRSTANDVRGNLTAAYRGNPDGSLRKALDGSVTTMMLTTNAYLGEVAAIFSGGAGERNAAASDSLYPSVVRNAIAAWAAAQSELDRLLRTRIEDLLGKLRLSLGLTGALALLSIAIAVMTHRHIVRPLEQLERVASEVRETKDYNLRIDYTSKNEIGQLTAAFNDMLAELAAARERERSEQFELARAARLTTMGAMTASIAHEINQPLAAIVANSNAAQRWLSNARPDLDEARAALQNIVRDGHRASQVIGSVRAIFKKDSREKDRFAVNDVIEDILTLVEGDIRTQRVLVRTELHRELPEIVGDRTQLQQVFMNLIMNAVEAMAPITDRQRLMMVKSQVSEHGMVIVTVEDSGTGIDPKDAERIFDAFYTTKADGMGMGLSICRSIIEAHGGRLWASPGVNFGSVFHVALPSGDR